MRRRSGPRGSCAEGRCGRSGCRTTYRETDRRKVLQRIVWQLRIKAQVEHDVRQAAQKRRVSVRRRFSAACVPTTVPAPGRLSTISGSAETRRDARPARGRRVKSAAGWLGHDDLDGLVWKRIRGGRERRPESRKGDELQDPWPAHGRPLPGRGHSGSANSAYGFSGRSTSEQFLTLNPVADRVEPRAGARALCDRLRIFAVVGRPGATISARAMHAPRSSRLKRECLLSVKRAVGIARLIAPTKSSPANTAIAIPVIPTVNSSPHRRSRHCGPPRSSRRRESFELSVFGVNVSKWTRPR